MSLPAPLALRVMVDPLSVSAPVAFPAVNVLPEPEATIVLPSDESVVKVAVSGVVVPIAVPLMPSA